MNDTILFICYVIMMLLLIANLIQNRKTLNAIKEYNEHTGIIEIRESKLKTWFENPNNKTSIRILGILALVTIMSVSIIYYLLVSGK